MNTFTRLQNWYLRQCDGDWEHSYGIKIGNIDNPGWQFEIDLRDSYLENIDFTQVAFNCESASEDHNWYLCKKDSLVFTAACGPHFLERILIIFLDWAESFETNKTEQDAAANP